MKMMPINCQILTELKTSKSTLRQSTLSTEYKVHNVLHFQMPV